MKKRNFVIIPILLLLLTAALCGCGAKQETPAQPTGSAAAEPVEETAAEEPTEEPLEAEPSFQSRLILSAVCVYHDGYKTWFTKESAKEMIFAADTLLWLDAETEDPFAHVPTAFNDNGRAMVALYSDGGAGHQYYNVFFTEDYGETWRRYRNPLDVSGGVAGMISDGTDFWVYGYGGPSMDGYLLHMTEEMDSIGDRISVRMCVYPDDLPYDGPSFVIRGVSLDPDMPLLRVIAEEQDYDDVTIATYTLTFTRELALVSAEKTE